MATVSMSLVFQNPLLSPYHSKTRPLPRNQSNWFQAPTRTRTKPTSFSSIRAQSGAAARKEDIVIVGAGIAGLATALSLHRLFNLNMVYFSNVLNIYHPCYCLFLYLVLIIMNGKTGRWTCCHNLPWSNDGLLADFPCISIRKITLNYGLNS